MVSLVRREGFQQIGQQLECALRVNVNFTLVIFGSEFFGICEQKGFLRNMKVAEQNKVISCNCLFRKASPIVLFKNNAATNRNIVER